MLRPNVDVEHSRGSAEKGSFRFLRVERRKSKGSLHVMSLFLCLICQQGSTRYLAS